MATAVRIKKEAPRMDVRSALDLLGAPFRGDHVGGMAEWLKNAVDAYIREDVPDSEQWVVVHMRLGRSKADWEFECIDFVGASYQEVYDELMVWCNPEAASRGKFDTFGGHGNGGKFHMRENFRHAALYTYRDGLMTVLGFQDKEYGFDPRHKGTPLIPSKAIALAGIDLNILPRQMRDRFERGDVRFTLVRGTGPTPPPKWRNWRDFVDKLQRHGQAKQLLDRVPVAVAVNGRVEIDDLDAPSIPAKPGFERPRIIDIPAVLPLEGDEVRLGADRASPGKLTLRVSGSPFPSRGADTALNAIDIQGKVGVIASYRVVELPGVRNFIGGQFIYGHCQCPVLEQLGCKENDRRKLAENDYSEALLKWIGSEVDELANKVIEQADRERMRQHAAVTTRFNALLNKWKNKFLEKLFIEVTIGPGVGPGFGGTGGGGTGGGRGDGGGGRGKGGEDGSGGGGAGDQGTRKAPKFPVVLISGYDKDPDTGEEVWLDPRQDVVYQRPQDIDRNVWWVNAQRPLAERIIAAGPTSERFRDYLLQRYIDIIQIYAVSQKWKAQPDVSPDDVSAWMLETIAKVQDSAAKDLEDFLFGQVGRNGGEPTAVEA